MKRIKGAEADLGAFPDKIPAKTKLSATEDDDAVYEGERDGRMKQGFGIKKW